MDRTARGNMSSQLIVANWNDSAETAYQAMRRNRIRHLPVVDPSGNIVGIISDRDLHRGMLPNKRDYVSVFPAMEDFDPEARVQDLMSWPVKTVDESTPIKEVALGMISNKISAYLVSKDSKTIGIITHEDLLQLLVRMLGGFELGDVINGLNFKFNASIGKALDQIREWQRA